MLPPGGNLSPSNGLNASAGLGGIIVVIISGDHLAIHYQTHQSILAIEFLEIIMAS